MPGAEDQIQPGAEDDKNKDLNQNPNPGGEGDDDGKGDDGLDLANADAVKAEIKKLRDEAAKARIKNKELAQKANAGDALLQRLKKSLGADGDDVSPEEKLASIQQQNEALQTEIAFSQIAREHDIPKEHDKYFRFLMAERMTSLEENAELDEKDIGEIVAEVKTLAKSKGKNSTGLNSDDQGKKPAGNNEGLTVEKFVAMNVGERSSLYVKNPAEYNRLFTAAAEKRLI